MRRAIVFVLSVLACRSRPAVVDDAQVTASPSAATSVAVADAAPMDVALTPQQIVERWNTAHVKHDLKALEALYAPHVQFYGKFVSRQQCLEAKKNAFAKSPDYTQSVRDIQQSSADGIVRFTKTSTSAGKSKDYPAILVLSHGSIVGETDAITDANLAAPAAKATQWCLNKSGNPTDEVVAPYKLSAKSVYERVKKSKLFIDDDTSERKYGNGAGLVLVADSCSAKCDKAAKDCGYFFRFVNPAPVIGGPPLDMRVAYVDGVTGVMQWLISGASEGTVDIWGSETLPN